MTEPCDFTKRDHPHRGDAAMCYDCGRLYGEEHGFPDFVIPNEVWNQISPTGDEGGLLCPSCIVRRLVAFGLTDVPGRFTSGPTLSKSQTK